MFKIIRHDNVVKVILLASLALSVLGLIKNPSILKTSWTPEESYYNLISYTLSFCFISFLGITVFKKYVLKGSLLFSLLFALYALGINDFLIPAFIIIVSCHIGLLVIRLVDIRGFNEHHSILVLIGLAIFSFCCYLLSHTKFNNLQVYTLLLLLPLLISLKKSKPLYDSFVTELVQLEHFSRRESGLFLGILYALSIHFHQSLRPEFDFDALAAHLMIPHFVKANGYWNFDYTQFVFGLNQLGADLLYAFSYVLGGEGSTRFLNFLFFCLLLKLVYEVSRSFTSRVLSLLVCFSLALTPVMYTQTTTLHIESVWVLFILGINIVLVSYLSKSEELFCEKLKYIYLVALFSGTALAVKMPTLFYLPVFALVIFLQAFRQRIISSYSLKIFVISLLVFCVFGLAPYFYCYYVTGNPVFPYFNGFFQSPYFYTSSSFNNPIYNKPLSYRLLYDMTFHGSWFLESLDHPLSLLCLIFFMPVIYFVLYKYKDIRIFFISLQVFISAAGIFIFQSYFRYLLPSIVLYFILIAVYLEYLKARHLRLYQSSVFSIIITTPLSIMHIPDPTHIYKEFGWNKVLTDNLEEDKIFRRPQQVVFDYLNIKYGSGATVFHIQQPLTAGLDATSLVPVWYNPELARRVSVLTSAEDVRSIVKDYGISHFVSYTYDIDFIILKDFIDRYTTLEMDFGPISLYKVNFDKIPEVNKLSGDQNSKSDLVGFKIDKTRKYLFSLNLKSQTNENAKWSSVVEWKNSKGESIGSRSMIDSVGKSGQVYEYYFRLPEDADFVYISLPPKNDPNFSLISAHFVPLGDSNILPEFKGE